MDIDSKKLDRWTALLLLILAGAVFSSILFYARKTGMLCFDDAYITFRYAENLALGRGLVFNRGERVFGSSTPFFCLVLAGLRLIGIKTPLAADLLNLLSLIFSAALVFLVCRQAKDRILGLSAAFLFIFFPYFWRYLPSGMETMFAIFLALVLVWLDLKERPVLAGLVAGLLLLTRIDALALLAGVALMRFFQNRRQAIIIVSVCLLTLLPWLIFSQVYFHSFLPYSLLAKKLIHPLPAMMVLTKYFLWFLGFQESGAEYGFTVPVLMAYTFFAIIGAILAIWKNRWALVFVLWLIFFFAGMAYGRVGPFPWYKIPMLSGYLVLCALGIQWLCEVVLRKNPIVSRVLSFIIIFALILWFCVIALKQGFQGSTDKEKANLEIAKMIKTISGPGDKILVGEVGIIGYELMDYYIIDSAGITSAKVYQIRKRDKESLMIHSSEYKWDWWGTPEWVKSVLMEYKPEFIASEMKYLHLKTLTHDPEFVSVYQPVANEHFNKNEVVLFQRKIP